MAGPTWEAPEQLWADRLIKLALEEDLATTGDITSQAVIPAEMPGRAVLVARQEGVLAGLPIVNQVYRNVDSRVEVLIASQDGEVVLPGTRLGTVSGPLRGILTGERTALNFLQRLSGVASQTRSYVKHLKGTHCQLLDTRKTTPGWRVLEKYAVRCGGGHNHRMGLFDAVMLKDNHLAGLRHQGVTLDAVIHQARERVNPGVALEVEVDNLDQLRLALTAQPDIVLLDNMKPEQLREAVALRNSLAPQVRLEASGGITLQNLRVVADTGVDFISVGALTHSAVALDIALDYES